MRQLTKDEEAAMKAAFDNILNGLRPDSHLLSCEAGFIAGLEYAQAANSEITPDSRADDLAQEWITKYTRIELDSEPYRKLVRAFLQFGNLQAIELKAMRDAIDRLVEINDLDDFLVELRKIAED